MEAVKQLAAAPEPVPAPETISLIGADMTIVGKILCDAPVQVFGHIVGELRASTLVIREGARVEGSMSAQEVTTIRAVQVKLLGFTIGSDRPPVSLATAPPMLQCRRSHPANVDACLGGNNS
jgi:hypothetical protein